jgi:SAM-dependent methyltransferase
MTQASLDYLGTELELFLDATNWKRYWAHHILPYIRGQVAEVGAGIGANTSFLCMNARRWVCLEPDARLAEQLRARMEQQAVGMACEVMQGTIALLPAAERYDCILYIDVLEHIEDDRAELAAAALRLAPSGYLVVLAPAHQWLFSNFDAAIGHYRRYSLRTLASLTPPETRLVAGKYLDSLGVILSGANRFFLQSSRPTSAQIRFWDKFVVPISRWTDPILAYRLGKSALAVWKHA